MAGLKGDKGDPGTGGTGGGTGTVTSLNGIEPDVSGNITYNPDWADVTSKPLTFAPSAHTHTSSDVTDLTTTVQGIVNTQLDIAGAPGLLDTINELAAAINDDPNFFTTMTNALALKAPLASPTFTGTVSGITKTMVGLGNVDNTADTAKPVSTAQQTALNLKANLASPTFTGTVVVPDGSFNIAKTTGLQTALDGKAALVHTHAAADVVSGVIATARLGTGTANSTTFLRGDGTWQTVGAGGSTTLAGLTDVAIVTPASANFLRYNGSAWANYAITKSDVGLSNVDNTADTAKPVSTAQQTALNLKADDSLAAHLAGTETLSGAKTFTGGLIVTTTNVTITDKDVVLGTTTGTKFGTATTQKLGFFNATPVVQQTATTDLGTALSNLGLRAAGTAYPITTSGATTFSGTNTIGAATFNSTMRTLLTIQTTATLTLGTHHKVLADATAQAITLTLPTALGVNGREYIVEKIDAGANTVTVNTTAGQTIDGVSTKVIVSQNEAYTFVSDGTNWTVMSASHMHPVAATLLTGTIAIARIPTGTSGTTVALGNHTHAEADIANLTSDLAAKAPLASPTFTGTVSGITAAMVGLGNVNNTSDASKPISTLTQAALDLKAPLASPTFTGTVSGITKTMVGLGSVDNTADVAKAVLSATKLATARTISGVSFDGTANIAIRIDQLSSPTAAVSMNAQSLTNLADGASAQDAVTVNQLDNKLDASGVLDAVTTVLPQTTIQVVYASGWTLPTGLSTNALVGWHFIGGTAGTPPPSVSGTAVWTRAA
jgi:hypothetical protein